MFLFLDNKMGSIILISTLYMNMIYGIYIGHMKPLESRNQNYQEILNEYFV